ncbi:MAG: hypothetical protein LBL07_15095 [Tannerella sp.]|jgi:hypothetical protein|nr:hypothetical protein [Tannerella sp.]
MKLFFVKNHQYFLHFIFFIVIFVAELICKNDTTSNDDSTTGNGDGTTGNGDGTSDEDFPQTGWTKKEEKTNHYMDGVLYKQSKIVRCFEGGISVACSESCKYRIRQNNDWSDWYNC